MAAGSVKDLDKKLMRYIFNSPAGEETIIVLGANGQPLDAARGPLALRALADTRSGPRHVRNLCGLRMRVLQ